MEEDTDKILKDQMRTLPKEVLDFILSSNWDTDADEIGSLYNLSADELSAFKREVTFVLAGLVHPDAFEQTLEKEVGIKGAVLEALVANVDKKIFTPIRPALIEYFDKEASEAEEQTSEVVSEVKEKENEVAEIPSLSVPVPEPVEAPLPEGPMEGETFVLPVPVTTPSTIVAEPARVWEKAPEVIPANLPTEETTESFLPNLIPKTIQPEPATPSDVHPFEEKMKKVFTAGQQSIGDLTIAEAVSTVPPTATPEVASQVVPPVITPKAPTSYAADPYREPIE